MRHNVLGEDCIIAAEQKAGWNSDELGDEFGIHVAFSVLDKNEVGAKGLQKWMVVATRTRRNVREYSIKARLIQRILVKRLNTLSHASYKRRCLENMWAKQIWSCMKHLSRMRL